MLLGATLVRCSAKAYGKIAEHMREVEQRKSMFSDSVNKNAGQTRAKVLGDLHSLIIISP